MRRNPNIFVLILTLITLVSGASSLAQNSKRKKRTPQGVEKAFRSVKVPTFQLNLNKRGKAVLPPSALKRTKIRKASKVAPPRALRHLKPLTKKERNLEAALDEEIKELYRLIRKYKKSKVRGKLWLRQAELYSEKSRLVGFRLQEDHEIRTAQWERSGKRGPAPKLKLDKAQQFSEKAIELYNWFLEDFKKDERVPLAMYFLGYNYFESGKYELGKKSLYQVVKRFPKSKYSSLAEFQLAEFLFEERKWKDAMAFYRRVLSNKKSENYLFSLYKYGWAQYHVNQTEKAIRNMKKVMILANRKMKKNQDKLGINYRLREEAKRGVIYFYAETGNYQAALNFFQRIARGKEVGNFMAALAESYADRGMIDKSSFLYKQVLDEFPNHPRAPYFSFDLISQISGWEKPISYHRSIMEWTTNYDEKSQWRRLNRKLTDMKKLDQFREEKLRVWVLHNHRGIQYGTKDVSAKRTLEAYNLYFDHFKTAEKYPEIRYFYADLLFTLKRYKESAYHYQWLTATHPKSPFYKDSLINSVLALEKTLPPEDQIQTEIGKTIKIAKIPPEVDKFLLTSERFLKEFPKDGNTLQIRYRMARLLYLYNHFEDAEFMFNQVITMHPDTEYAEYSANLILDIYNLRKDYKGFLAAGKRLADVPGLKKKGVGKDINEMMEKATFQRAETTGSEGNFELSAQQYIEFAENHLASPLVGLAYFNAAVNFEKAGKIRDATSYYKQALITPKNDKYKKTALAALGKVYEKSGRFREAAVHYEKYAELETDKTEAANYLYNSAVIWSAIGAYDKAYSLFEKYKRFPNADRVETDILMGNVSHSAKRWKKVDLHYNLARRSVAGAKRCFLWLKVAKNELNLNRKNRYLDGLKKSASCVQNLSGKDSEAGIPTLAEARFLLAKEVFHEVTKPYLGRRISERQKVLEDKLKKLNLMDTKFKEVIRYNVAEFIVSALSLSGEAYRFVADFVQKTPEPRGLAGSELQQYRGQVKEITKKMSGTSESYFVLASEKATQLGAYPNWLGQYRGDRISERGLSLRQFQLGLVERLEQ